MIKLAVIGDPMTHTMSPILHKIILEYLEIEYSYEAHIVKRGELENFIKKVKDKNILGFNVTMPHKIDIIGFLDELDEESLKYNSVNTVKNINGRLYGYSTDGEGFIESLNNYNVKLDNKNILMLGAGGVSNILVPKIAERNPKKIVILNRDKEKAKKICDKIKNIESVYDGFTKDLIARYAKGIDILINATPLGMHGFEKDFKDFNFLDKLKKDALVYDLIYNPSKTMLLKQAEDRGLHIINGLDMLINQAILSDEIYLDRKLNIKETNEIVNRKINIDNKRK